MKIEFKIEGNILYIVDRKNNDEVKGMVSIPGITEKIMVNNKRYSVWINDLNQEEGCDKTILYRLAKMIKVKNGYIDFKEQFFDIEFYDYINKSFILKYKRNYIGNKLEFGDHLNYIRFQYEREANTTALRNLIKELVNANLTRYGII